MRALTLLVAATIGCAACGGRAETAKPAEPATAASPAGAGDAAIAIDKAMVGAIKIATVGDSESANLLSIAGKVQFDEDRVARVLAPLAGQVIGLRVKVGDQVRKGQELCALNSRDAAVAVGEYIESRKDVELAQKSAAMTQDLFDHEAASKMALQQAQNDLAKARARVARTEEALRVLGLTAQDDLSKFNGRVPLTSPIAGVVVERKVTDGQFVQSDSTPLLTVANLDAVWVVGDLFERDLRLVGSGQAATITTAAYPDEKFEGRVGYISDSIDPASRTAKVRVSVVNPHGRLKPEMYASIVLNVGARVRGLRVPAAAVFTEGQRNFVYVQVGEGRFEKRLVDLEEAIGADRQVIGGLHAGDRVVVDGALLLRQEEQQRAS